MVKMIPMRNWGVISVWQMFVVILDGIKGRCNPLPADSIVGSNPQVLAADLSPPGNVKPKICAHH